MNLLTLESVPALQAEVRALAAERDAVILAHNYQLPEVQDVADFVGDSLGLAAGGEDRRRGHRLLRRALHGRDGVGALAREDRAAAGFGRGLLAGGLDHRGPAARVEGRAPERARRHVREHDGRGEGGDRLLRTSGNAVEIVNTFAEHRRPRSSSSRTCSSAPTSRRGRAATCTCGWASVTSTRASPERHRRQRANTRRGLPDSSGVRMLDPAMEYVAAGDVTPRGSTCSPPAACWAGRRRADGRRRSWRPRPGCCTRCRGAPRHRLRGRQRGAPAAT